MRSEDITGMAISDGQGYTLRRVGRLGVGGEGIERYGYTPALPVDNRTKLAYLTANRWNGFSDCLLRVIIFRILARFFTYIRIRHRIFVHCSG